MSGTREQALAELLTGLARQQREVREALARGAEGAAKARLVLLGCCWRELPEGIRRRLTHTDGEAAGASPAGLTGAELRTRAERAAGEAALAQTVRAANLYRRAAGLPPLDGE